MNRSFDGRRPTPDAYPEDPVPVYEERPCSRHAHLYGWFTEGSDTPELKDAKALLDEFA